MSEVWVLIMSEGFEWDYCFFARRIDEYVNEFDIANGYANEKKKNWVRKERFEICKFNKYIEEKKNEYWAIG